MPIEVSCACGKRLRAPDRLAGKKAKCPSCGTSLSIPVPAAPEEDLNTYDLADDPKPQAPPAPRPSPAPRSPTPTGAPVMKAPAMKAAVRASAAAPATATATVPQRVSPQMLGATQSRGSARRFLYLALLFAMIPLAWMTFHEDHRSGADRLDETVKKHPEIATAVKHWIDEAENEETAANADEDKLFNIFPEHRFEGALLAHESWAHWGFAIGSGALFFAIILLMFPLGTEQPHKLLAVGLFTATVGILFLLAVQWIAEWTQGYWLRGRGIIVLVFYILKFIGFSYRAALDPETNFFVSFFGFTFGVGLCEEFVKALPVLVQVNSNRIPNWRCALLWGLISGVGFGVAEGISYSSHFYNGIHGGGIYLVRFISCVALHAVWSGSTAVFIFRRGDYLRKQQSIWGVLGTGVLLIMVPMVLHGLYDTLLKKEYHVGALIAAIASFAWLAWQIEWARKELGDGLDQGTVAAAA